MNISFYHKSIVHSTQCSTQPLACVPQNCWSKVVLGVVFTGGREISILGKNMVGKRYFQDQAVPVITEKINKKSVFEIIRNGISIFEHRQKKNLFRF